MPDWGWSSMEDAALRVLFRRGLDDDAISAGLRELGYERSASAVKHMRRRKRLLRRDGVGAVPGGTRSNAKEVMSELDERPYWQRARSQDQAFQDALRLAGVPEFVDKRPCTENARVMRAEPEVRSSGHLVYPTGGPDA